MGVAEYRNLVGGKLCPARSGKFLDSINPATGEVWARIPASDKTDVDAAVAAARAAFPAWSALPIAARANYLKQVAEIFVKHGEELARFETLDNGWPLAETLQFLPIGMKLLWERSADSTLETVTGRSVVLDPTLLGFT